MQSLSMEQLRIGWFDLILVSILVVGAFYGRKRGMSGLLLPLLQWIVIVVMSGLLYAPLALEIEASNVFTLLFSNIVAYLVCVFVISLLFVIVRKVIGGKPISGDKFGQSEYYLGMGAGVIEFFCILVVALALLNARKYTQQEIFKKQAYEKDLYGSSFFPSLYSAQAFVFRDSFSGALMRDQFSWLLIEPTTPGKKDLRRKKYEMP